MTNGELENIGKIRCFIGAALSPDWQEALGTIIKQLKPRKYGDEIHWNDLGNLHLTLRFLGEIEFEVLQKLIVALKENSAVFESCAFDKAKLSLFPPARPHTVAITLSLNLALAKLKNMLEKIINAQGIPVERRPFLPHLSLGKIVTPPQFPELSGMNIALPEKLTIEEMILFRSIMVADKRAYLPIVCIPCRNQLKNP